MSTAELHFASKDMDEARAFLRKLGLQMQPIRGWSKPGWCGLLQVCRGEWHVEAWRCEQ